MLKAQHVTYEQINDALAWDEGEAIATMRQRVETTLLSGRQFTEFGVTTVTWRWHPVDALPDLTACAAAIASVFARAAAATKENR